MGVWCLLPSSPGLFKGDVVLLDECQELICRTSMDMVVVLAGVIIDLLGTQLPHKMDFSTSFRGDASEMETKRQKCGSWTCATKCWTIIASPIISTLIDMGCPSSLVVWPAAMCTCEQRWYSASGRLNSQSAISTFSRGALMIWATVDMESVRSPFTWFPLYVPNL